MNTAYIECRSLVAEKLNADSAPTGRVRFFFPGPRADLNEATSTTSEVHPQAPAPACPIQMRLDWSKYANLPPSSSDQQELTSEAEEPDSVITAPCRVTLRPPGIRSRSPFAGRYGIPPQSP